MTTILDEVRQAGALRLLFLPHAVRQMARPERMISVADVAQVVQEGTLVEDYPDDARGHSCLLLGFPHGRAVHVVCSPRPEYLAIITAYLPEPTRWSSDFRRRNG